MNEDTSNEEVVEETVQETPKTTESEPSTQQEEPQQETPQQYAGKYSSPEDLEKAYLEAQRKLSEQGAKLKEMEQPVLPADKQQILDELKALGVVTSADLQKQQAVLSQKTKDDLEIKELKLSSAQESALRKYATHPDNLSKSMSELWDELNGTVGGKVVSRKTTIKPKTGVKESGFKVLSPKEAARLDGDAYDKYWADYAQHMADNNS